MPKLVQDLHCALIDLHVERESKWAGLPSWSEAESNCRATGAPDFHHVEVVDNLPPHFCSPSVGPPCGVKDAGDGELNVCKFSPGLPLIVDKLLLEGSQSL